MSNAALDGGVSMHHDYYSGQQYASAGMTRKWDSSETGPGFAFQPTQCNSYLDTEGLFWLPQGVYQIGDV